MKKEDNNENLRIRVKDYLQGSSNAFVEKNFYKFLMIGLFIITAINSVTIQQMEEKSRTILIPPSEDYRFEIKGSTADDAYLFKMARYIADTYADVEPGNVQYKLNELLTIAHTDSYQDLRDQFKKRVKLINRYKSISHHTVINESVPIKVIDKKQMIIKGHKYRIVGNIKRPKKGTELRIDYIIENGRFWLKGIEEITNE